MTEKQYYKQLTQLLYTVKAEPKMKWLIPHLIELDKETESRYKNAKNMEWLVISNMYMGNSNNYIWINKPD